MLTTIDYIIIAVYLVGVAIFGVVVAGKQRSTDDYFLGGRQLPWWAICFSVVATETSTLTVIGVPAVSYLGSLVFIQLAFGYLLGRVAVSFLFLPKYFSGELATAYEFLGNRFGQRMRTSASLTFMVTRLLADGVRLFATAIPIKVMLSAAGIDIAYWQIISIIGVLTIVYTYIGGLKAVVWMDVVQMVIYVGGGVLAIYLLSGSVPSDWWAQATAAGKTQWLDFNSSWLDHPYAFVTAVGGGAVFSMASHGTDQLIVQRLLACRNAKDSKKALIGSGFVVLAQFGIFLVLGLLLWSYYEGANLADLGLSRGDEIYPRYIIEGLPAGVSGLILAGIFAAAMSTLSSSLNALASSSVLDIYYKLKPEAQERDNKLKVARSFTLFWGVVFIFFATLFENNEGTVIELGLAIASYTYGGLLGSFLLGLLPMKINQGTALIAFFVSIIVMAFVIKLDVVMGFIGGPAPPAVAWPLYTVLGAILNLTVGVLLSTFLNKKTK